MRNERDRDILSAIVEYCCEIEETRRRFGDDYTIFEKDKDYFKSVSMSLLQIGELAGKLSDDFTENEGSVLPWRKMKNMRNIFAHAYKSVDDEQIWLIMTESVPELKQYCNLLLNFENPGD